MLFVINADPDNPDQSLSTASISSPIYRDSYVKCVFEFWHYLAGDIGSDGYLMPVLVHSDLGGKSIYLDKFVPDSPKLGIWHRNVIGIGQYFQTLLLGKAFDLFPELKKKLYFHSKMEN